MEEEILQGSIKGRRPHGGQQFWDSLCTCLPFVGSRYSGQITNWASEKFLGVDHATNSTGARLKELRFFYLLLINAR